MLKVMLLALLVIVSPGCESKSREAQYIEASQIVDIEEKKLEELKVKSVQSLMRWSNNKQKPPEHDEIKKQLEKQLTAVTQAKAKRDALKP